MILLTGCSAPTRPALPSVAQPAQREGIVIAGSGVNLPLMRKLATAYEASRSAGKIEIPDSIGSSGAIKAIMDKGINLGLISRPLLEKEQAVGLKQIQYARSAVIIAVHPSVQVDNISVADLLAIYNGSKRQWPDQKNIIPHLMYKEDAVNGILADQIKEFSGVLDEALRNNYWKVHYNDLSMARAIASIPGSIGFSDCSWSSSSQEKIKALQLDGVSPTPANIISGEYRLDRGMYFVYQEPMDPRVKDFLAFVFSPEGQQIIQTTQVIPVPRISDGNH
jgi:phosphate transport system substrate-binding protein